MILASIWTHRLLIAISLGLLIHRSGWLSGCVVIAVIIVYECNLLAATLECWSLRSRLHNRRADDSEL